MRRASLLALVLAAAGCGASHRAVSVAVTPSLSAEDQPLTIRVTGLRARQGVWISLRAVDAKHVTFVSRAAFGADTHGVVDTAHAIALRGSSYAGVWPMGLITSMSAPDAKPFTYYHWGDHAQRFTVTVVSRGVTIATTSFERRWASDEPEVVHETVAADGFLGTFYAPRGAVHRPAVLAFGGSEGGAGSTWLGGRLAASGVPVLVLGYFHAPGLPDRLVNIPLEYFRRALVWLERRPEVDAAKTSVMGGSYGSEAALLLGVDYPKLVHGVVALVPSDAVTCGIIGAHRAPPGDTHPCLGSPWTLGGKPLPHTTLINNPKPWDVPASIIPVERIGVPLLLACGAQDQIWSSCPYARAIVARRKAHGEQTKLIVYPQAGHFGGDPFFVYEPGSLASDFYVPADERAREDLTPRVLAFLRQR